MAYDLFRSGGFSECLIFKALSELVCQVWQPAGDGGGQGYGGSCHWWYYSIPSVENPEVTSCLTRYCHNLYGKTVEVW